MSLLPLPEKSGQFATLEVETILLYLCYSENGHRD